MTRIGVLGAGSWGTTLANQLARSGHEVVLWAHEAEVVAAINQRHENTTFLPECPLDPGLTATADPVAAIKGAEVVLGVTPSHVMRDVVSRATNGLRTPALWVSATKGLEPGSLKLMSQVLAEAVPGAKVVALSGPSFALEVYRGQPTAVTAASNDEAAARQAQQVFTTPGFRVYWSRDVIGVELGGALKNVVAIAAGILDGLGLGFNPRAALITRGLAEITRLGAAMGADPLTFAGLAGIGDLVLTTTGSLSRNRSLGLALAQGQTLEGYTARHRSVAEGVTTARSAVALGERHGVELPICQQVYQILFAGKAPADAVKDLMERAPKMEQWR